VAVDKARELNMPQENIKRAISRGAGEGADAMQFEEIIYEGYGPGGAAVIVETLTDNRNRTSSELKALFSRNGGNMGEPGSVAWMFQPAGMITFDRKRYEEESVMDAALEAGADDFRATEQNYEVVTPPDKLETVRKGLVAKGLEPSSAELTRIPKTIVPLEGKNAEVMVRLLEVLEDHDDVQNVYANFDMSEKLLESLVEGARP
jgi:YebC/PmpR family DNA-binding regulatory protein